MLDDLSKVGTFLTGVSSMVTVLLAVSGFLTFERVQDVPGKDRKPTDDMRQVEQVRPEGILVSPDEIIQSSDDVMQATENLLGQMSSFENSSNPRNPTARVVLGGNVPNESGFPKPENTHRRTFQHTYSNYLCQSPEVKLKVMAEQGYIIDEPSIKIKALSSDNTDLSHYIKIVSDEDSILLTGKVMGVGTCIKIFGKVIPNSQNTLRIVGEFTEYESE